MMKMPFVPILGSLAILLFASLSGAIAATERVSVDSNGIQNKGDSRLPSISDDGRFIAFVSLAKLLPEDTNAKPDVYVKDRETGVLRLVSDNRGGDQAQISGNGQFVVYRSLESLPRIRIV